MLKELREMKEAGEGAATCFSAKDEGETTVVKECVSEVKGEGAIREDMLDRVGGGRVIR